MRSEHRKGLGYGFSAYLLWGLFPLYWPLLKPAGAVEILAQRMVWSLLLIAVLMVLMRNLAAERLLMADRAKLARLALAAVLVLPALAYHYWLTQSERWAAHD